MAKRKISIPSKGLSDFCQRYQVQKLAFFGSVLREDFNEDSDVDVLVTFMPGARVGFLMLGRMKRELEALVGREVDIVPEVGLKPVIRDEILESSEVVYAA